MRRDVGAPVQRNPTIVENCKKLCNTLKECDLLQPNFQTQLHKDKQNEQASSHKEIFLHIPSSWSNIFSINYLINKEAVHAMATACFLPSTSLELLEIHIYIHIHIHCCSFATTLQKLARQRKTHIHIHTNSRSRSRSRSSTSALSNLSKVCFYLITTNFVVIRSVINI